MGRHHRRTVCRAGAAVLLALVVLPRAARAEDRPCPVPTETARVAAVVDDDDLALEDGRTLRLAGIDPARATPDDPGLGERMRGQLEAWLVGQDVSVAFLSATADRWERFSALVAVPTLADGAEQTVNARLVARGWARVRPEPALRGCLADWLGREAEARQGGLGLWADPYYAVLAADDAAGLGERAGAMVLVEGRLHVGESQGRVVLRFGGAAGLAAVVRGGAKGATRLGLDPRGLTGVAARVRGVVDDRFGPRIDLTDAGQIERLEAGQRSR